jgi:hypothetical protein
LESIASDVNGRAQPEQQVLVNLYRIGAHLLQNDRFGALISFQSLKAATDALKGPKWAPILAPLQFSDEADVVGRARSAILESSGTEVPRTAIRLHGRAVLWENGQGPYVVRDIDWSNSASLADDDGITVFWVEHKVEQIGVYVYVYEGAGVSSVVPSPSAESGGGGFRDITKVKVLRWPLGRTYVNTVTIESLPPPTLAVGQTSGHGHPFDVIKWISTMPRE